MPSTWPLTVDWNDRIPVTTVPDQEWMWPPRQGTGPGLRVLGRYRLEGIAWQGGQADIWTATDEVSDRRVAIKTLRPDVRGSRQLASRRLIREARILHLLAGDDHVMELHDRGPDRLWAAAGEDVRDDDGSDEPRLPWIALPLHIHATLDDVLASDGPFDHHAATELGRQLALALVHVHALGVVHRDISPRNVLLTRSKVVLGDFGVAWTPRYVDAELETVSSDLSLVAGRPRTEGWFAPEILAWDGSGEPPDRGSAIDVFNWGLYTYACVVGRHPWSTGREGSLYLTRDDRERMYRKRPPRPQFNEVPAPLRDLIDAALSPNPDSRPAAARIVDDLTRSRPLLRMAHRARSRWTLAGAMATALAVTSGVIWSGAGEPSVPAPRCATATITPPADPGAPPGSDQIDWAAKPAFAATGTTLYEQSFADPAPGWPVGTSNTAESRTDGCAYLVHPLHKGDSVYVPAPAPDDARVSDQVVTATATLRSGQGFWGVWCRGTDAEPGNAYYFEISHTAAVRILVLDGSPSGGGTGWHHLDGVDVRQPTTVAARCADVPDAPVRLIMAVNGREVLSFDPRTPLLGPGYAGVSAATFSDVDGPTAQEAFTKVTISQYQ